MTREFIDHWENVVDNRPDSPEQSLAQRMVNMRKIVFSSTQTAINGRNLEVENGDLAAAVQALKKESGKDIYCLWQRQFCKFADQPEPY